MKKRRFSLKEFRDIYSRVPRLCVEVVVKTPQGIVLTKRAIPPAKGMWHVPGGTVLKGERLEDVIRRVAREELGLRVKPLKLIGATEYFISGYFGHPVSLMYLAKKLSGTMRLDEQASAAGIFKKAPRNLIPQSKVFLLKHKLLKR